jgi:hypothetical protein
MNICWIEIIKLLIRIILDMVSCVRQTVYYTSLMRYPFVVHYWVIESSR